MKKEIKKELVFLLIGALAIAGVLSLDIKTAQHIKSDNILYINNK